MFQFVGKVLRSVWGEEEEEDDDTVARPIRQKQASDATQAPSVTINSSLTGSTRTFTGHVTSVHSDYGLVDHVVYFPFKLCHNFPIPKVGTKVEVTAQRKQGDSGWLAESVVILQPDKNAEDWDDVTTTTDVSTRPAPASQGVIHATGNAELEDMVAMVTGVDNNVVLLNENLTFDLSCATSDYAPCKGDWVTCTTRLGAGMGQREVLGVLPLRTWDFDGEVTSVGTGFGYVQCGSSDVYFSHGACRDGYTPRRLDRVRGWAVECSRGRCPWRAIHVVPVKEIQQRSNIPPSPAQSVTSALLENKGQIEVTDQLEFGEMQINEARTIKAFVTNKSSQTQTLLKCRFCNDQCQFEVVKFDFVPPSKDMDPTIAVIIPPGKGLVVLLSCTARYLGMDKKLVVFEFKTFKIGRYVCVTVGDTAHRSILEASAPYSRLSAADYYRSSRQSGAGDGWLVPGQRPSRSMQAIKLPNRLPSFPVPSHIADCYLEPDSLGFTVPALGEELCLSNYSERFSALLHLEEIQEEINIRQYDLERVCLRRVGEFLALGVPGLAEGRPSVIVGDSVIMTSPGLYDNEPDYQGYVHEVLKTEVLLKFHTDFHNKYNGEDYNVRFTLNRTPARRCHQAVKFASSMGSEVLFPTKLIPKVPQTQKGQLTSPPGAVGDLVPSPVRRVGGVGVRRGPPRRPGAPGQHHEFFNPALNARQRAAVVRILGGQGRPAPYLLFGPPGTGKTVTVVEALLQVLTHMPASRIIACTPSNSAADLLCQRLHMSGKVKPSEMVRLNSYSRREESAPEVIRRYLKTGDDLELVSRHRLLICTCSAAGQMYSLGLRAGHFTHVFIDEAGQATEPETLVAVGLVAGADGQVVLAGDPCQLGPVLQSRPALQYGLGLSLLERLIHSPLYERNEKKFADHGSYDPLMVTKLVENYRSHGVLLKLPSMLFYHNELLTSADPAITESLTAWDKLPNSNDFPLIFHGIRGEDLREGNSPSWFNPMEALQVMRYLQALHTSMGEQLDFDDIGIIAPYRKQVEKIRLLINKLGMDKVKVGSVEEFQGQERLVMIISTVRSNEQHLTSDARHNLGFLSNPKRFNVAISRAQALMVVVGNPHVLTQDENWKILIKYCVMNNAYLGCDLPDLTLACDLDLNQIPRASTPLAEVKEAPAPEMRLKSPEKEGPSDADVSESDGDDTLSIHSADTEIYACSQDSPRPPRLAGGQPNKPDPGRMLPGMPDCSDTPRRAASEYISGVKPAVAVVEPSHRVMMQVTEGGGDGEPFAVQSAPGETRSSEHPPSVDMGGEVLHRQEDSEFTQTSPQESEKASTSMQGFQQVLGSAATPGQYTEGITENSHGPRSTGKQVVIWKGTHGPVQKPEIKTQTSMQESHAAFVNTHKPIQEPKMTSMNTHRPFQKPKTALDNTHRPFQESKEGLEKITMSTQEPKEVSEKVSIQEFKTDTENTHTARQGHKEVFINTKMSVQEQQMVSENTLKPMAVLQNSHRSTHEAKSISDIAQEHRVEDRNEDNAQRLTREALCRPINILAHTGTSRVKDVVMGVGQGAASGETQPPREWTNSRRGLKARRNTAERLLLSLDSSRHSSSSSPYSSCCSNGTESMSDTSLANDSLEENVIAVACEETGSKVADGAESASAPVLDDGCVVTALCPAAHEAPHVNGNMLNHPTAPVQNASLQTASVQSMSTQSALVQSVSAQGVSAPITSVLNASLQSASMQSASSQSASSQSASLQSVPQSASSQSVSLQSVPQSASSQSASLQSVPQRASLQSASSQSASSQGVCLQSAYSQSASLQSASQSASLQSVSLQSVSQSASLPSASLPSVSLPSVSSQSASLQSVSLQSVSLQSVSLQSASLQSVSLSTSLQSASLQCASLQSASLQSASENRNSSSDIVVRDNAASHALTELDRRIIRQMEYYFSDFNMSKDTFMQKQIAHDSGWVPLDILITFKRLAALSIDFTVIMAALRKSGSGLLEVDEKLCRVRRSLKNPLLSDWSQWKAGLKERSRFVIGLKTTPKEVELREFFKGWGEIEHIQPLDAQKKLKNDTISVTYPFVIIFKNAMDAQRLGSNHRGVFYANSQLYIHFRDDVLAMLYKPPKRRSRWQDKPQQQRGSFGNQGHCASLNLQKNQHLQHPLGDSLQTGVPLVAPPGGLQQKHQQQPPPPQIAQWGRGRGGAWSLPGQEAGSGAVSDVASAGTPCPATPPAGWSCIARGRGLGYSNLIPSERGGVSGLMSLSRGLNRCAAGTEAIGARHAADPVSSADSGQPGGAPFVNQGGVDNLDDSLDQYDSDVVIESSEEEILEN